MHWRKQLGLKQMSPVAGHFDFPEYAMPLTPYKGQKKRGQTKYKIFMFV